MMEPDDTQGLAMLDEQQDSATGNKRKIRPELLLGLGLLALIVGWGVWSYWHDQNGRSNYIAGQNAEVAKDWDDAQRYFAAAGDYAGAAIRASNAAVYIKGRNEAYQDALSAISQQNWLHAYNALGKVRQLQPDFADSETRYAQAKDAIYSDAFSGTIVMRSKATPPGLYQHTATGWQWLEGSDISSQSRSYGDCDAVVYDAVGDKSGRAIATPTSGAYTNSSTRLIKAARLEDGKLKAITLDKDFDIFSDNFCTHTGILAEQQNTSISFPFGDWRQNNTYAKYNFFYQDLDDTQDHLIALPNDSVVVGIDLAHGHLIAAQVSGARRQDGTIPDLLSHYYFVNLRDSKATEIATSAGIPIYASANAANTQLMLLDNTPLSTTKSRNNLKLINLTGAKSEYSLAQWDNDVTQSTDIGFTAWFLAGGPFDGKLLQIEYGDAGGGAWLLDPNHPETTLWSSDVLTGTELAWPQTVANNLLLSHIGRDCTTPDSDATLLNSSYQTKTLTLNIPANQMIDQALTRKDRLIYVTADQCWSGVRSYTINSMPLSVLANGQAKSLELYSTPTTGQLPPAVSEWNMGEYLLAYLKGNELHAVNYDGTDDMILETDVTTLYQTRSSP